MNQQTVRSAIDVLGVGLHTGRRIRMQILPAAADSGIRFARTDLAGATCRLGLSEDITSNHSGPSLAKVVRADHATTLAGDGFTISTVEHLLAAFAGLGIDNALVTLSDGEVPIMDGSAAPFVYLMMDAGIRELSTPRREIRLRRPVSVNDGDRAITVYPSDHLRFSYTIDFAHPAIGRQGISVEVDPEVFIEELAPARTFCLLKDVEALRERGLALGGSLANAVVVGDAGPLNTLRFSDEFVRHKALDLLGDLALLGHPVVGHVVAHKAGHAMHAKLIQRLIDEPDAWTLAPSRIRAARVSQRRAGDFSHVQGQLAL